MAKMKLDERLSWPSFNLVKKKSKRQKVDSNQGLTVELFQVAR
uniref:Uncharacterized protein n=1 Tax=Octopus bimaculoides TaxID=37653 RepID=A0A0L8H2T7_OCTBM